jgi:Ca2+-binding RTX toxin-like protein
MFLTGNDIIYANGGADTINSGTGTDIIWLAGGAATITLSKGEGFNKIYNF